MGVFLFRGNSPYFPIFIAVKNKQLYMTKPTLNLGKTKYWILGIILFLIVAVLIPNWIVEWLWLDVLGYKPVFWKLKGTQFILFLAALGLSLVYIIPNMYFLSKNISELYLNFSGTVLEQLEYKYIDKKQIRIFLLVIGSIFSLLFALNFYSDWDGWFRLTHAQTFGETDPIFGKDIGFYIFQLPFIQNIQSALIILVFFMTLMLVVIYMARGSITLEKLRRPESLPTDAVKHVSVNVGIWLLLLSFGYYLGRYKILFSLSGAVFGAGYTDMNVVLPVLWTLTILVFLLALLAFYQSFRNKIKWLIKGGIAVFVIGVLGQFVVPQVIQSMVVKPNELKLEEPYLVNNIDLTRKAYGLDKFHETSYNASDTLVFADIQKNMQTINNIRLWDPRPILETYRQLQEIRLYYSFPSISINRYRTNRGYEQMMVAGRELNTSKLPQRAQTWVNEHLQYTHGYGVTMSPVAETDADGNPILVIKDLPPVSTLNLELTQPAIYYGERTTGFKLVNTLVKELDYPEGKDNVYTHYNGRGGVPIDNFFRKLLFAIHFGDYNLMLTEYIKEGSKIQFWRDVQPRIQKIAPFLKLKEKPYLVLDGGKLYWIQDAYTDSRNYPYAQTYNGRQNYIRNSVKIVVDAFHGDVDFFVSDEEDPVLKVYREIFPDMFKPLDQMPGDLINHIRYPEYLFKIQMMLYSAYHMTNPQTFYNNEDLWERPNSKYAGRTIKMETYYIVSKLPHQTELQYMLISPLTPHNRDNMIAWMAAESDFPNYGQVHVYELPKSRLFLGPAQIEAKIDQNTEISQQLSLWDQLGSSVIRGNLMIIPVENSFIYVEPVFLIADGVNIPQLKRVIATMGEKVVMEPTLHNAINALFDRPLDAPLDQATIKIPEEIKTGDTEFIDLSEIPEFIEGTEKLESIKSFWEDMQKALKDQKWEEFGKKMEKIDSVMRE